jgi:hypothetical protein
MVSENAQGDAQNAEKVFGFDFSEYYHKDGDEFLSRVTDDETWVPFVSVETRKLSKLWMHTHSPDTPKNLNNRLPES